MYSPKEVRTRLTTFVIALGGRNQPSGGVALSSQTPRAVVFAFEFEGALFQLEAREPAFEPFVQFAPNSTASVRVRTHA